MHAIFEESDEKKRFCASPLWGSDFKFKKIVFSSNNLSYWQHYQVGLQRYTELSSIRGMASGEPAYRITSHIFARFTNFLAHVIVLKIGKLPDKMYVFQSLAAIISGEMCAVFAQCMDHFFHISKYILENTQLVVSNFI